MTKKHKFDFKKFKEQLPYITIGALALVFALAGSISKQNSSPSISLNAFAEDGENISVDQLSELYLVADLSDSLSLASSSDVASNYVTATSMYDSGQTATGKLEKPNLTDITACHVKMDYEVKEGETVDSIANGFSATADQIRWSNGLKNNNVSPGTILKIPCTPGIIYIAKRNDTIESIASKYGSNPKEITELNDLEFSGVTEGMELIIKDGYLPNNERPEYVSPRRPATNNIYNYSYTYLGNTSERIGLTVIGYNGTGGGQCVGYALWYRNMSGLSGLAPVKATWGNARNWAAAARRDGFVVNGTPEVGAVFQTPAGAYGHVGIVVGINGDGSIVVQETNYGGRRGVVVRSTIPAEAVGRFQYIH